MEEIRLGMQNLGSFLDDIKRMVLIEPALPVEMIFKIGNVRLALFRFGKELLVGRDVHSRGLNLQTHSRHARKRWAISKDYQAWVKGKDKRTSLTTRSCVLTVKPFSS
jgi:hypothetical protein